MKSMWLTNPPKTTNPFSFLLFVSRPYRFFMVTALSAVSVAAILTSGTAYAYKLIINAATHFNSSTGITLLWHGALLYIALSVCGELMWRSSAFLGMRWTTGARATARYTLSEYVIDHSPFYFGERFAGSISSKITHASNSVKEVAEKIMWQFGGFTVMMATSFALMYSSNHMIAFIFLSLVIVLTPLNVFFASKRRPYSITAQKKETELGGATVDMLTNITAVKEYVGKNYELSRLVELIIARRDTGLKNWLFSEFVLVANGLIQNLFTGSMMLFAIYLTLRGVISPGDITLIFTLVLMARDRLTFIGSQINEFSDAWGQIEESLEDILEPHDIVDTPDAKPLEVRDSSITIRDLSFEYGSVKVFDHFNLTIPAMQKVGLVGRSGAGKSTLVKLLLRSYDITSGSIEISGQGIESVTQDSLRGAIAVVPQEPLLFHRSIRENIAYGKPDATLEEIQRATKLAQAHDFIERLPNGYESLVGERGVKLSGGQRQRVAIARALLKDAPILLLDEATSSLDSESEAAVQKALFTLMEHRTVIAIAHRLSTLRVMDRIIVMDDGKIVEDGTHAELLKKGGLYAELWSHQAGGFLEEEKA